MQYLQYLQTQANNGSFYVLLVIMVIDVLTGVILATARKSDNTLNGRLESRQLIKGIYRKMGEILIYLLGVTISFFTNENAVAYLTIAGIIAHESLSVIENLALLNVPIPQKLKDILEVIKKGGKNGKD